MLSLNFFKNFWRFELHINFNTSAFNRERWNGGKGGGNLPFIEFCIVTF